jgi:hypothetical protein
MIVVISGISLLVGFLMGAFGRFGAGLLDSVRSDVARLEERLEDMEDALFEEGIAGEVAGG